MVLEMKGIEKAFGNLSVLKDISLQVDSGEVVSIIGPSGSGKSLGKLFLSVLVQELDAIGKDLLGSDGTIEDHACLVHPGQQGLTLGGIAVLAHLVPHLQDLYLRAALRGEEIA